MKERKRPFVLFFISNLPYYSMFLLLILMLILLASKLFSTLFETNIKFNDTLILIFEIFLLSTILSTAIISILLYIYFFLDFINNKDISCKSRKYWKKIFIFYPVFVNSLYFDFKYPRNKNFFLFERFIIHSRDKILGSSLFHVGRAKERPAPRR